MGYGRGSKRLLEGIGLQIQIRSAYVGLRAGERIFRIGAGSVVGVRGRWLLWFLMERVGLGGFDVRG